MFPIVNPPSEIHAAAIQDYIDVHYTNYAFLDSREARMKSLKRGWGFMGLDLNSGWN